MQAIAEAIGRILELSDGIEQVFADPPEGVSSYPSAIVLDIGGASTRAGLRGLWETTLEARVWLLAAPRGQGLPEVVKDARTWGESLARLFAEHDELTDTDGQTVIGEIVGLRWATGALTYGNIEHAGVDLTLSVRVDIQAAVSCE
jgi:hypothetical protein